jgi:ComF family protein
MAGGGKPSNPMVMRYLKDFFSLLFPACCNACGTPLYTGECVTCTYCSFHLPRHRETYQPELGLSGLFIGRVKVEDVSAYYTFQKGAGVQQLIHGFKYRNQQETGIEIGRRYGLELKKQAGFSKSDLIVPVPLHPSKLKRRGYNQSAIFARGLSQTMGIPVNEHVLLRATAGNSQTRKSRFNRWKNVEAVFQLKNPETLIGKQVLLVDDVITTGATLEACAHTLLQADGVQIRIAALAFAASR